MIGLLKVELSVLTSGVAVLMVSAAVPPLPKLIPEVLPKPLVLVTVSVPPELIVVAPV